MTNPTPPPISFPFPLPGHPDLPAVRRLDTAILPFVRACGRNGMRIDIEGMAGLSRKFDSNMARIEQDIGRLLPTGFLERFTGDTFNIDSPDQVADLLFDALGVGRGKQLKTTPSGKRASVGKKQLELLSGETPIIPLILEYRQNSKLKGTFSEKLARMSVRHPKSKNCPICGRRHYSEEYRVHPELLTTRTATWRFACKNPNLQQIPSRTVLGREIRAQFIAGEGRKIVSCDMSQIELRMLAHCANESGMIDTFWRGGDIHTETAMDVFGLREDQIDPILHRAPCKVTNFGVCYGLSASGLQLDLALSKIYKSVEECQEFIDKWFAKRPMVRGYMDEQQYHARRYGFVWNLFGFIRLVPEVRSSVSKVIEAGLRQAGNMRITSTSAGVMKLAIVGMSQPGGMEDIWRDGHIDAAPLMTIHDELLYEAEEDEAEEVAKGISKVMDGVVELKVPVRSDWKVGERWEK